MKNQLYRISGSQFYEWLFGTFEKQAPGACFSKVPKHFGRISGDIILFVSSKRRRLEARHFAVIFIFIPFTTYEKTSFTDFRETAPSRKDIRNSPTRLFCEAGLFICCKENKNYYNYKVLCLQTSSFWRYKENYVTRNAPEKFREFWATGAWGLFPENPENFSGPKCRLWTAIRLFSKADLLTCFLCEKKQEDCEGWWLRTSALRRYKVNCGIQNRPEKFRNFGKQALGHKLWLTISSLHVNARTWAEASISRRPFWNCTRKRNRVEV